MFPLVLGVLGIAIKDEIRFRIVLLKNLPVLPIAHTFK